jgi:polyphosphate kinase 2 (PPK2 family)
MIFITGSLTFCELFSVLYLKPKILKIRGCALLEIVNLDQKLGKQEWAVRRSGYQQRLYDLEKAAFDTGVPTVVVFEGWDAAGKGTCVQTLTSRLDPRGFTVWPIRAARTSEQKRPWLWRFWNKLPNYGHMAIFDRSWYGRVTVERVEYGLPQREYMRAYTDIVDFERLIALDGYVIVKFFLHISQKEQARRFRKIEKDPLESWRLEDEDRERHRYYDEWLQVYEEMLERTDSSFGPWTIVEATNRRFMLDKVYRTLIATREARLGELHAVPPVISEAEAQGEEEHA